MDVPIDNKRCYSCNKIFRIPAELTRHKNRKTPCLIREIPDEQIHNPLRCIFCNKIFANKGSLTKHHGRCKIKNGGMDMLADKVRYDQEIRILKEKDEQKQLRLDQAESLNREMAGQIAAALARIDQLENKAVGPQTIINGNVNNINNITINNYLMPNIDHLLSPDETKIFIEGFRLHKTNMAFQLIPKIWFNPDIPENFSMYFSNIRTEDMLISVDGHWVNMNFSKVGKEIRVRIFDIVKMLYELNKKELFYESYAECIRTTPNRFHCQAMTDEDLCKIKEVLVEKRHLVESYVVR